MTFAYNKAHRTTSLIKIVMALMFFSIGGFIYLAYRTTSLKMFEWIKRLGLYDIITDLRISAREFTFNDFILYSLPDGLWVISYIFIFDTMWNNDRGQQVLWCGLLPFIGIASELLQGIGLVRGTFDFYDLLCYAIPYLIYLTFKSLKR